MAGGRRDMRPLIVIPLAIFSLPVFAHAPASNSTLVANPDQRSGQKNSDARHVEDSVSLGDIQLTLGMPQDSLLSKLEKRGYKITELGESSWNISSIEGGTFMNLAAIGFTKGKLSSVSRDWGPQDQKKGAEFAAAVIGVLAHLEGEGKTLCMISTVTSRDPNADADQAFLTCGHKYVEISVARVRRGQFEGEFARIDEVLRAP
jgi:hypothetical protein